MAVTRMGWQQESAPSVFRLNQSIQVLGDLIDQQPARAVIEVPDPGPGERPRPSTRWEGIAEQHQDLRGGMASQLDLTRMPDQALQRIVLGSCTAGEAAGTGVVLCWAGDNLVSGQVVPDELRVPQVAQPGCGRKCQMGQQLSAEVTLINDAAAALVYLVEHRLQQRRYRSRRHIHARNPMAIADIVECGESGISEARILFVETPSSVV